VGRAAVPGDVMLFCSVLYNRFADLGAVMGDLTGLFGDIAFATEPMPFTFTTYYEREMGAPLERVIAAFGRLVGRDFLPEAKNATNALEDNHSEGPRRKVNIDPGIVTLENVCLATTKPHGHRLYLGRGIWAEVTLIYQGDSYRSLPWTYPDYASERYIGIFNSLRALFKEITKGRS